MRKFVSLQQMMIWAKDAINGPCSVLKQVESNYHLIYRLSPIGGSIDPKWVGTMRLARGRMVHDKGGA